MYYIILFILSVVFWGLAALDVYKLFGFSIKNPVVKLIIYFGAISCGLIDFIIDIYMILK